MRLQNFTISVNWKVLFRVQFEPPCDASLSSFRRVVCDVTCCFWH